MTEKEKAHSGRLYDANYDEELCREANKWELSHGGISGRTATQFVNYIMANN